VRTDPSSVIDQDEMSVWHQTAIGPRFAVIAVTILSLSGCNSGPLKNTTSLSPAVESASVGYSEAVEYASDKILLENILRMRDFEPLNLSQLSSVSGALSLQGTAGFSLPWGTGLSGTSGSIGTTASTTTTANGSTTTTPGVGQPGVPFSVVAQKTATPSVTAGTSPTFTVTPLNTQAFTLNIMQPISSTYVLNRWQAGIPRELLLLLFVKEIDFQVTDENGNHGSMRYLNDPDNEEHFAAFLKLVDFLLRNNAQLKAIDVLDPVGPPFALYAATQPTSAAASDLRTNADSNGFNIITSSADGQYHVGNSLVVTSTAALNIPTPSTLPLTIPGAQLYRVYAGQVELCVDPPQSDADKEKYPVPSVDEAPSDTRLNEAVNLLSATPPALVDHGKGPHISLNKVETEKLSKDDVKLTDGGMTSPVISDKDQTTIPNQELDKIADDSRKTSGSSSEVKTQKASKDFLEKAVEEARQLNGRDALLAAYVSQQTSSPGANPNPGGGGSQGGGARNGSSSQSGGGSSMQVLTAALQAGRVSAIVSSVGSDFDEVVLDEISEKDFQKTSQKFAHIQWRSVSEVFEYLGGVLRFNQRRNQPLTFEYTDQTNDSWVAEDSASFPTELFPIRGAPKQFKGASIVFDAKSGVFGRLSIQHNGFVYSVTDGSEKEDKRDYSMIVLSMLNQLVNYSSVSGGVSSSTPVRLLPIP